MKEHKTHSISGKYCWTCQRPVEAGVPGWPKKPSGPFVSRSAWGGAVYTKEGAQVGYYGFTEAIVWANGDVFRSRDQKTCGIEGTYCARPVERPFLERLDPYREIYKSEIK